jgi:hypothetical protein
MTDQDRAVKIATIALHRAMADDLPGAADYVKRLSGNDLLTAILGWIDTYIVGAHPGYTPGSADIAVAWLNLPTGDVETADEVSPSMRWAGRLIAARAADDEEGFMAVLRSLAEGTELGDGVMALLHVVAASLNNLDALAATGNGGPA